MKPYLEEQLKQFQEFKKIIPGLRLEICFADDDRTCQAVRKFDGKTFKTIKSTPPIPVKDCDSLECRCIYLTNTDYC